MLCGVVGGPIYSCSRYHNAALKGVLLADVSVMGSCVLYRQLML